MLTCNAAPGEFQMGRERKKEGKRWHKRDTIKGKKVEKEGNEEE